jgi:hypothetical protein
MKDTDPTPSTGMAYASVDDIAAFEATGCVQGVFYAWLRLRDGRAALWDFQLGAVPGSQDQRLRVIPGA